MSKAILNRLFGLTHMVTMRNLEGISDEEAGNVPEKGGSSLNFVVGHMVDAREDILKLLNIPSLCSEDTVKQYSRGSTDAGNPPVKLEKLRKLYNISQDRIVARFDELTEDELQKEQGGSPLMEELFEYFFHETYHAGQLGILRRMLGKPGVLK